MPENSIALGNKLSPEPLSKTEAHHIGKRVVDAEKEAELVAFFRENQDLRYAVLSEPFSQEIEAVSQGASLYAILRCALLTQEKGETDAEFSQSGSEQKKEKIYEHIDWIAETTVALQEYIEAHLEELASLSDAEIYTHLNALAFGTTDEKEIQQKYTLSQKRVARLGITNFLESRAQLQSYQEELAQDHHAFIEKYLKIQAKETVRYEALPIGIVLYLQESDYEALLKKYVFLDSKQSNLKKMPGGGFCLAKGLLKELQSEVIVIYDDPENQTEQYAKEVRNHELRHILFALFYENSDIVRPSEVKLKLEASINSDQELERVSTELWKRQAEDAKNEIIAYYSTEGLKRYVSDKDLRLNNYEHYMRLLRETLDNSNKTVEVVDEIEKIFIADAVRCLLAVDKVKLIAKKLYEQAGEDSHKINKVSALLAGTHATKIDRLAHYVDLSEAEVRNDAFLEPNSAFINTQLDQLITETTSIRMTRQSSEQNGQLENWLQKIQTVMQFLRETPTPYAFLPKIIQLAYEVSENRATKEYLEVIYILLDCIDRYKYLLSNPDVIRLTQIADYIQETSPTIAKILAAEIQRIT